MNAILSLCHFCELHGPKVIFNTQPFRDPHSLSNIGLGDENSAHDVNTEEFSWKYGRIDKDEPLKSQPSFLTDTCSACRSFPHNKAAVITNYNENHVSFVSSQFPFREEVFTSLRQAGIRSLSCEVYSEREGPIYFGDQQRGHVISYTFFLKDIQARGFLRRYSILVMMTDKMFLLNSWSFFIKYIEEIIKFLQELACKVYSAEEKSENLQKGLKPPISSDSSKRHRAAGNPRPLTDIVGEQNIWTILHTKFTWILKAGGLRLQEKLVEGPPLLVPEVGQQTITLQCLMSLMTPTHFEKMLHHLYIGNRIIFESSDSHLLFEIPLLLKPIIPFYLFHPRHLTSARDENGTSEGANIVTVSSTSEGKFFHYALSVHFDDITVEDLKGKSSVTHHAQVTEHMRLKTRPPQIVSKICSLIEPGRFSNSVLNLYFATLIDEWTNKIKIWSFIKNEQEALPTTGSHLQHKMSGSSGSSSTFSPEKKALLSRSPPSSPQHSGSYSLGGEHNLHLTVVGALECDIPMLNVLAVAYEKYCHA